MSIIRLLMFILLCVLTNPIHAENPKDFLILRAAPSSSDMFDALSRVLYFVDMYDKGHIGGVSVDFVKKGIYYDRHKGKNWWNYYFEPLEIGEKTHARMSEVGSQVEFPELKISKNRAHHLINQYMRLKPFIADELNQFIQTNFANRFVIGIHYERTESYKADYEEIFQTILDQMMIHHLKEFSIYVATDDKGFINYLKSKFSKHMIYQQPPEGELKPFERGKIALLDAWILSHCQLLIPTQTKLSKWATYLNPEMSMANLHQNLQ